MKTRVFSFVSILVIVSTLVCFFVFRSVPATRIWEKYMVLCVERSVEERVVLDYLESYGCTDVISLSSQRVPLKSNFTAVEPVSASYLSLRDSYFFDQSGRYALYYIDEEQEPFAVKACNALTRELKVSAALDGKAGFPFLVPITTFVVFLFFTFFAAKKSVFVFPALFPLLITLSQPFYPAASLSILLMLAIFLMNHLWGRKKLFETVLSNPAVVSIIVFYIVLSFVYSFSFGMLSLLCVMSSALTVAMAYGMGQARASSFSYEPIFSSTQVPLLNKRNVNLSFMLFLPLVFIFVMFLMSARFTSRTSVMKDVTIPMPSSTNASLVDRSDFYRWAWKTMTFPYKNLYDHEADKNPQEGDRVTINRFEHTDTGIIATTETVMVYDDSFRSSMDEYVLSLDYPAVEKLMVYQSPDRGVSYSEFKESADEGTDTAGVIVILSLIVLLVAINISYFITSGSQKKVALKVLIYENSK